MSSTFLPDFSNPSPAIPGSMDTIILRDLRFELSIGLDAWRRPNKLQPVSISINLQPEINFYGAALHDDVSQTVDYGKLYKSVCAKIKDKAYGSPQGLMLDLAETISGYQLLNIDIVLPKALLRADEGLHYHLRVDKSLPSELGATWSVAIKKIVCSCIIGVNPHERIYKQKLSIEVIVGGAHRLDPEADATLVSGTTLHEMVDVIVERVNGSSYQTVEALATAVAQIVTMEHEIPIATIMIEKPSAINTIETAAVQITRTRAFFENKDFWKVKRP